MKLRMMGARLLVFVAAALAPSVALALPTSGDPPRDGSVARDPSLPLGRAGDVPMPSFGDETSGQDEIPGEVAVDLRDDVTAADIADVAATYGLAMHPNSSWSMAHDKIEVADVDPP